MYVAKLAFLFIISSWGHLSTQDTVKVTLYYAALCPHCERFIQNQLYPGYKTLGDSLELDLIPYGTAKYSEVNGKWEFKCPHGPNECYAHKLQSCVLNKNYTQEERMNFIGCLSNTGNPENNINAEKCANETKLSWNTIKRCANGNEGNELFAHYVNVSNSLTPRLEYVPHIIFNDKANKSVEDAASEDFLKTVCGFFIDPPKSSC